MLPIFLFEDDGFANLLPLVYWRTVFELRSGRKTLLDRAADRLGCPISGLWTRDWIAPVAAERLTIPVNSRPDGEVLLVNGRWLMDGPVEPRPAPYAATCGSDIVYLACDASLAGRLTPADLLDPAGRAKLLESVDHAPIDAVMVDYPWTLVATNADALLADWAPGDRAVEGQVSSSAVLVELDCIHVAQRAVVEPTAVIDARPGPIYIGEGARIGPHTCVVGPAYIGPGATVNPHSFIHGGTTIGPVCKVGGEIDACVFTGYSNKQHHGFLGHSYVGSWVNLGAGTVNSDLKNTYGPVRVPVNGREIDTGMTFFGAIIADHVKTGIRQTLPTGAVLGFAAMAAQSGILPKFLPSFSWLTDAGRATGDADRLLATARRVMQRREVTCSDVEASLFKEVARIAAVYEAQSAS